MRGKLQDWAREQTASFFPCLWRRGDAQKALLPPRPPRTGAISPALAKQDLPQPTPRLLHIHGLSLNLCPCLPCCLLLKLQPDLSTERPTLLWSRIMDWIGSFLGKTWSSTMFCTPSGSSTTLWMDPLSGKKEGRGLMEHAESREARQRGCGESRQRTSTASSPHCGRNSHSTEQGLTGFLYATTQRRQRRSLLALPVSHSTASSPLSSSQPRGAHFSSPFGPGSACFDQPQRENPTALEHPCFDPWPAPAQASSHHLPEAETWSSAFLFSG